MPFWGTKELYETYLHRRNNNEWRDPFCFLVVVQPLTSYYLEQLQSEFVVEGFLHHRFGISVGKLQSGESLSKFQPRIAFHAGDPDLGREIVILGWEARYYCFG